MRQEYLCEKCGVESHVSLHENDDVWGVAQAIFVDHSKWSPNCDGGRDTLRILGEPFNARSGVVDGQPVEESK